MTVKTKTITSILILFSIFICFSFTVQNTDKSDAILGIYLSPNKKSKVEFFKKEGLYYGKTLAAHGYLETPLIGRTEYLKRVEE